MAARHEDASEACGSPDTSLPASWALGNTGGSTDSGSTEECRPPSPAPAGGTSDPEGRQAGGGVVGMGVPGGKENGAPALLAPDLPHASVCSAPGAQGSRALVSDRNLWGNLPQNLKGGAQGKRGRNTEMS